ncbi:TetR/AcrR family transcriptional regulator [Pseudooceanicola nitratireducens]|uniref:TetR/AcrR family transcriptional regulator n=1 Tax=Pseudooceanicola nitratireducens TaxID=517719 RepID=UPI003C7BDF9B
MDQPTTPADDPAEQTPAPLAGANETSDRFRAKRDRILDAAAQIINDRGLRGLTFVSVADLVEMNTTSITYYFKRKELLAAATLERTISHIGAMTAIAAQEPDVDARISRLLWLVLEQYGEEQKGTRRPLARLSDMRSLEDPLKTQLFDHYMQVFRQLVALFDGGDTPEGRALNWARTHILLETLHWCRVWIGKYSTSDHPRVHARMMELYRNGYAAEGASWSPAPLTVPGSDSDESEINHETYLRAATITMNERGYRGASVTRIAAHLNLSKGSFYHHLAGKDDLVTDCFDRSYTRISLTQRAAMDMRGSWFDRLSSVTAALTDVQFAAAFPLLRITALMALPGDLRGPILQRSDRITQRFAGMMIDGISEGSIRATDPLIASHCLIAGLNAAYDFRHWADRRTDRATAVRLYNSVLAFGMIDG